MGRYCRIMGKQAAAAIVALTVVALWYLLCNLGVRAMALPTVLTVGLGSDLWVVGSQSLWQHGPAALCLTAAMLMLSAGEVTRGRLVLAGLATALLVACRSTNVFFAAALLGYVLWRYRLRGGWFLLAPVLLGAILLSWNLWWFGTLEGGQAELERISMQDKGFEGSHPLTGSFASGAAGTLFSPARGLLVYCPWVALTLVAVPLWLPGVRQQPMLRWLLPALIPYFVLHSLYFCWWAGWCFGPRYWTDAMPVLGIVLGFSLDRAWCSYRGLLPPLLVAIAFSVGLQAIGALCYPSNWCAVPSNVDLDRDRLWDWCDTEVSRCLSQGLRLPHLPANELRTGEPPGQGLPQLAK
jgi:hypothetical protein